MRLSKRFGRAALTALTCFAAAASIAAGAGPAGAGAEGRWAVGVHAGTLGVGAHAGFKVSEGFAVRALFNQFKWDYEKTVSRTDYKGELDLGSFGLVADWHPGGGGFRFSVGVLNNGNEVPVSARGSGLEIGQGRYDANMDVLLEFEPIAPYVGIGMGSAPSKPGFGFALDLGVLHQRTPKVSGSGAAGPCSFSISTAGRVALASGCTDPALSVPLATDLEAEHKDLMDAMEDFGWYPVLALGVSYRF